MSNKLVLDKLDSETRDVINYLKNRNEVVDLRIEEFSGASLNQINEWEVKNFCNLPSDLKSFYSNQNGMLVEWKFKIDNSTLIPLGRMQINSLKDLTKVGSVLNKDFREPSIFDLEDIQDSPEAFVASSNSVSSFSSASVLSFSTNVSNNSASKLVKSNKNETTNNNENQLDEIAESAKSDNSSDENELNYDNEEDELKVKSDTLDNTLIPHFDETSCNFELDNCNGFGKVCLVYRNTKPGTNNSEQSAEIWFLDRSLQWHFLTHSFQNYYRLLIAHLGLPQWQALFTEDGLPPYLYQWYYMLAPGRILIHDNMWKKLEFLNLFDNSKPKSQQSQQQGKSKIPNKIDFSKLFEDIKQPSKNKSQNNSNSNQGTNGKASNASTTTAGSGSNQGSNNGISKSKSRIALKK